MSAARSRAEVTMDQRTVGDACSPEDVGEVDEDAEGVEHDEQAVFHPPRTSSPPTVDFDDSDLDDLEIDYPDFDPRTSFLISGPLPWTVEAQKDEPRGRVFTRRGALRWALQRYGGYARDGHGGRVIREVNESPTRWAIRVYKPGCQPKAYTMEDEIGLQPVGAR